MAFEDLAFKPPVHAIRVKTCGNDWVTDCDATLAADKVRGFALDSEGVKVYSRERDIHGDYDNIYVPYSNLEALVSISMSRRRRKHEREKQKIFINLLLRKY